MWAQIIPGVYKVSPGGEDTIRMKLSNIPLLTRATHRLSTWKEREGCQEGYEAAKLLADGKLELPFLLLYSGVGTGKTHLAWAVGWEYLESGLSVYYYQVETLMDELRQSYSKREQDEIAYSYSALLNSLKECCLLILDDIGAHNQTDWAAAKLDEIVDHRYINHLATIATSNTLELSERILDRMTEGKVVRLKGSSYRKQRGSNDSGGQATTD